MIIGGNMEAKTQVAILAGGCFWCLEAVFDELEGVLSVESGYSGGMAPNPNYRQVCTGLTGHAEVVRVTFDPSALSFAILLRVFFAIHDPTTLNRQGADVGTQYRSAIFYLDDSQHGTALEVMREIDQAGLWPNPIITELAPFEAFYVAEDYHQEYFANNPTQPYCMAVVAPKVAKFRKQFLASLKKK
jgi:peptide-methionine (S)-S-oxide reductase